MDECARPLGSEGERCEGVSVRSVSASARCECEVTEETEEATEEKEEEGVGTQSQKQETWGKIIGPGNPTCAIQLTWVGRQQKGREPVAGAARERRSLIVG